jgi:purine-binding chemotaxis protein CheW
MTAAALDDYLDGLLAEARSPEPAAPASAPAPADRLATPSGEPVAAPATAAEPAATLATATAPTAPAAAPECVNDVPAPAPAQIAPAATPAAPRPAQAAAPRVPAAAAPALPAHVPASMLASAHDPDDVDLRPGRRASDRTTRWLRLRCASQAYGLELLKVQEVVLPSPLLPLRGTPPAMLGVMNLRGQVVPVMDLGMYLGQPAQEVGPATRIVVLEEHGETLGLRVSVVEDVANLTDQQIESPDNARVGRNHSDLFRGIARLGGDPMILLDASCLLVPPGSTATSG